MSFQNAESAEIVIRHAHTTTAATRFACNAPRRTEICCWSTVHTWWFPKIGVSPNSSVLINGVFPYKPSILGYPHLWETSVCEYDMRWCHMWRGTHQESFFKDTCLRRCGTGPKEGGWPHEVTNLQDVMRCSELFMILGHFFHGWYIPLICGNDQLMSNWY